MTNDLMQMVKGLLNFPYPQICRHSVALDILCILEKNNIQLPAGLIAAVCKSSEGDEEALRLLT